MRRDLVAEALVEHFDGARFGSVVVRSVTVAPILNSRGDDAYKVRLVVEDPVGETWAVDDMTTVDLFANKVAYEAGGGTTTSTWTSSPSRTLVSPPCHEHQSHRSERAGGVRPLPPRR